MKEKPKLPETVEGMPVEHWAIEQFLQFLPDREIEKKIRAAMLDPKQNPVAVARSFMWGGKSGPNIPAVFFEPHGIEVKPDATWNAEPALIIPYARVVDYLQGRHMKQTTLF